jgi:hypothetical protein
MALTSRAQRKPASTARASHSARPARTGKPRRNFRIGPDMRVVVVPADVDHRVDKLGRPYAYSRGQVIIDGKVHVRTVMIHGDTYSLARDLLGVNTAITLIAHRERIVNRKTGLPGGEIVTATDVVERSDTERQAEATGRKVEGHDRKGYFRTQRCGKGRTETRIVWVRASKVNGGAAAARRMAA